MNRLIGEVLTLARFEAGGHAVETVHLGELLGDLVEDARFEAAARAVVVDYPHAPDLRVRANGELLQRAMEMCYATRCAFRPPAAWSAWNYWHTERNVVRWSYLTVDRECQRKNSSQSLHHSFAAADRARATASAWPSPAGY